MASAKGRGKSQGKRKPASKKTTSKKTASARKSKDTYEIAVPMRTVFAILSITIAILALFSILGTRAYILDGVGYILCGVFGKTIFLMSPILFLWWFAMLAFYQKRPIVLRSISLWMLAICIGGISHLFSTAVVQEEGESLVKALFNSGTLGHGGGVLGGLAATGLQLAVGKVLSFLILSLLSCCWFLGAIGVTPTSLIVAFQNRPRMEEEPEEPKEDPATRMVNTIANKRIAHIEKKRRIAEIDIPVDDPPFAPKKEKKKRSAQTEPEECAEKPQKALPFGKSSADIFDEEPITGKTVIPSVVEEAVLSGPEEGPEDLPELEIPVEAEILPPINPPQSEAVLETATAKVSAKEANESANEVAQEIAAQAMAPKPEYQFPPIDLLRQASSGVADGTAEMRENSRRLNEALQSFRIEAQICNVTRGPSVTRYEVELAQGVRLAKVTALQDDIALALGAVGVRISAIPDKIAVVGIEVPNKLVTTVALREVIDSPAFSKAKSRSSFAVGKDIGGSCVVGDISRLPHMLIAGTTGSGKSVCMNSIIISLLYKAKPEDVKLIMVDPKMVELGIYNGIPHLLIPVVTDPKKAAGSLQWAVTEMMRRYRAMSDVGVRDLDSFNRIVESSGEGEKLPQIVVIIDELADLMLVAAKEVEESICRIAQMGRAAGMHLIIATQRPSADVITGLMKANIPSRIAFAVASAMESRIILDTQGAEKLVGRGDMLYAPLGKGKPKRVQGCFVSDGEVEAVAEFVKQHYVADYNQDVLNEIEKKAEQSGKGNKSSDAGLDFGGQEDSGDELLPNAVDVVLETGQASVSMLQRRLKLGYARAARIVDEMEEKGIVGPFMGSKPRTILITKEQWTQMQNGTMPQQDEEDLESDSELLS